MDRLKQIRFKLRALWRRRALEAEMAEEMRAHFDRLVAANRAERMSSDEARLRALRQFGNLSSLEEQTRDEWQFRRLESLARDVRFATRQLRRNPIFAATAILSLSVGIGASTAIFSAVDAILLRDLPLPQADQLGLVRKGPRGSAPEAGIGPAIALEMVARAHPFAEISPFTLTQLVVRQGAGAERVAGMRVAATFFHTLGVTPALGRDFLPSDDRPGSDPVAIISSGLWQRAFGADPQVVGRALEIGNQRLTVVGVMPHTFRFPELFGATFKPEIWSPLAFSAVEAADRGAGYMSLLLKRRSEWPWDAVRRELDTIARGYEKVDPATFGNQQLTVTPLREQVVGEKRSMLLLLWLAVSCLLLAACANTANIVLSRTMVRARELAVRSSLGASRARLFTQLLAESSLLAVIAAAVGVLFAFSMVGAARQALGEFLPRVDEVAMNWRVLAFTIATTWVTSLVVGLLPAQRLSAIEPHEVLKRAGAPGSLEGRWATVLRRVLLVGQIGLAVLLGTAALLLGRSLGAVLRTDLGFQPRSLLTFELSIPKGAFTAAEVTTLYARLLERLKARPQVVSAGALSLLPLGGGDFGWGFLVRDKPLAPGTSLPNADVRFVTPGTLETLQIPLRSGRAFAASDRRESQPVALVNDTLARHVWPGESPIGKQIKLAGPVEVLPWMTVVGVVEDVRFASPERPAAPAIYRPHAQHFSRQDMSIVVRTVGSPADVVPAVREEVSRLGRGVAMLSAHEFTFYLSRSLASRRLITRLITMFAGVSLALTLVGVYGLFAYVVTSRTRAIGVYIALGATRERVVWMLMRDAVVLGCQGLVMGAVAVFAARRLIATQLFELQPMDAATFAVVAAAVLSTALIASYVPSRRAANINPTLALRSE
jgi:putative ABC transport system permease protein